MVRFFVVLSPDFRCRRHNQIHAYAQTFSLHLIQYSIKSSQTHFASNSIRFDSIPCKCFGLCMIYDFSGIKHPRRCASLQFNSNLCNAEISEHRLKIMHIIITEVENVAAGCVLHALFTLSVSKYDPEQRQHPSQQLNFAKQRRIFCNCGCFCTRHRPWNACISHAE